MTFAYLQVSFSAILFYGYVGVIGLAVWSALRYFKSSVALSQVLCTYGASLTPAAAWYPVGPRAQPPEPRV